ncbi:MAG: ImmA/IrrE family metallo-endopeptidase [Acidobacteria bacterium]|jgi:Zn-dependent peptidase ImmA (M78 family)|nr:ImmA/IrrE family metallo-endopeptidase [Acidobacteriota bacterium]
MKTFLKREQVEEKARGTLSKFEDCGGSLAPPIDVDLVGELVYDLQIDWVVINEDSRTILGGLYPRKRRIAMNETHIEKFRQKPGLERFTKGHEIGHWVLHVDEASLDYPVLPGMEIEPDILCRDGESSWRERQAEWFSSALLMPADILIPVCQNSDLLHRPSLYKIAEKFDVTITALSVRLSQLKLNYMDDRGNLYRSREEYAGQKSFI